MRLLVRVALAGRVCARCLCACASRTVVTVPVAPAPAAASVQCRSTSRRPGCCDSSSSGCCVTRASRPRRPPRARRRHARSCRPRRRTWARSCSIPIPPCAGARRWPSVVPDSTRGGPAAAGARRSRRRRARVRRVRARRDRRPPRGACARCLRWPIRRRWCGDAPPKRSGWSARRPRPPRSRRRQPAAPCTCRPSRPMTRPSQTPEVEACRLALFALVRLRNYDAFGPGGARRVWRAGIALVARRLRAAAHQRSACRPCAARADIDARHLHARVRASGPGGGQGFETRAGRRLVRDPRRHGRQRAHRRGARAGPGRCRGRRTRSSSWRRRPCRCNLTVEVVTALGATADPPRVQRRGRSPHPSGPCRARGGRSMRRLASTRTGSCSCSRVSGATVTGPSAPRWRACWRGCRPSGSRRPSTT